MRLDHINWVNNANEYAPQMPGLTPWFPGTIKPVRIGFYERHLTFSKRGHMHWWDGKLWRRDKDSKMPVFHPLGLYPAWRGMEYDSAIHSMHINAMSAYAHQILDMVDRPLPTDESAKLIAKRLRDIVVSELMIVEQSIVQHGQDNKTAQWFGNYHATYEMVKLVRARVNFLENLDISAFNNEHEND